MPAVVALERHGRVLNRAIRGITDRPRNDCEYLVAFVLAINCGNAQRGQRNECAEYPNNSGGNGGHQKVRSEVPVSTNLPVTRK